VRIGVVKEIKPAERRVALTPAGAHALAGDGHEVVVEAGAGAASGFDDVEYAQSGARIAGDAAEVWGTSELLMKVKEPIAPEYGHLREDLTLFAYLHLAADLPLIDALVSSGAAAIAYETVEDARGRLPLLAPMSDIAGRLATQAGAYFLQAPLGGNGKLIGGTPGVRPAHVLILGGGVVGTAAARVAVGMGAQVTILERSQPRILELEERFETRARVLMSDALTIEEELRHSDLVIGAVLVTGARAPHLITRKSLGLLPRSSVLVDVAIDQGGCAETSRVTTHEDPVYDVAGVVHYCVGNMPGGVPWTSTRALTNVTLPYARRLAAGVDTALAADPGLALGLNVRAGEIVYGRVAEVRAAAAAEASATAAAARAT
jgi:alanine dehydrogenase